jgi:putative lipoprotein
MPGPRTVSGAVVFKQAVPAHGTIRVRLEDTSRADAAARVLAEVIEPLTEPVAAGERRLFRLTVPDVDERARYEVRVHVDRSGSGVISPGDLITTRAYPVLTRGASDHVDVEVVEV